MTTTKVVNKVNKSKPMSYATHAHMYHLVSCFTSQDGRIDVPVLRGQYKRHNLVYTLQKQGNSVLYNKS